MNAKTTAPSRSRVSPHRVSKPKAESEIPQEWAWHYRTLRALRDHLATGFGDRLREPVGAMEPPSIHSEDLADELYDRELAKSLPQDRGMALREIDDAIQRICTGVYGKCEATGRLIPKPQLLAMPWRRYAEGVTPPGT
jgi:RNA polymerase-binding transcription factor DksA